MTSFYISTLENNQTSDDDWSEEAKVYMMMKVTCISSKLHMLIYPQHGDLIHLLEAVWKALPISPSKRHSL